MRAVMRSFLLLGLILAGIAADAQNLHEIKVNVPFTFTAAGKDLPAGEYHLFFNPFNAVVSLRGESSTPLFIMSAPTNPAQDGRSFLRFYCYGQHKILQDVAIAGAVRRVPPGRARKLLTYEAARPNEKALGAVTTPALITLTAEGADN